MDASRITYIRIVGEDKKLATSNCPVDSRERGRIK